ncbi:MAG: polyketide cyclase [Proteobacteria bacterium]|nr:polyketide cyclase [Pseudomonadota bacterium]
MVRAVGASQARLDALFDSLVDFDIRDAERRLNECVVRGAAIHFTHPFETLHDVGQLVEEVFRPLSNAIPDLERRMTIKVQGETSSGAMMVGVCGYYTGAFRKPYLGIRPTGQQVTMRFHEFFRIGKGGVEEVQAVWDLPELMMQAGVWPMAPALRRPWNVPAPTPQDGLRRPETPDEVSTESARIVEEMLTEMGRHPREPVSVMRLEDFWHPRMSWYGPAAIGACRGIEGFRNGHQIPFLRALPDRRGSVGGGYYFADGPYVAFTAWPGMNMSVTGDGWLGINPTGQRITMRSLDFWRVERGLIRENWVLVDMLHVWKQLGVDVIARAVEMCSQLEHDENYR